MFYKEIAFGLFQYVIGLKDYTWEHYKKCWSFNSATRIEEESAQHTRTIGD